MSNYYSYTEHITKSLNYYTISLFQLGGETPLHVAARWGKDEVVKVLIEGGANVYIQNNVSNQMIIFL